LKGSSQKSGKFEKKLREDREKQHQQEEDLQSVLNERAHGRNISVDGCLLSAPDAAPVAEQEVGHEQE